MTRKPEVEVLLSTYDGERFVREQVASVLAQQGCDVTLRLRDDGSRDGTAAVLRELAVDPRVSVTFGANIGPAHSFLSLLATSPGTAQAVAFADQDDVWLPDHLKRALAGLSRQSAAGPVLWCSRPMVADASLTPIQPHAAAPRGPSFTNALVENIVAGCSTVMNRSAAELIAAAMPQAPVMHDAWCYLLIAGSGTVIYDPEPSVLYRMHDRNAVGLTQGFTSRIWQRARRLLVTSHAGAWSRQASELQEMHATRLTPEAQSELARFVTARACFSGRLTYALTGRAHRQRRSETLVMRALFLAGRV